MSARDVASLAQLYVRAGRFEDAARAFGDAVCMDRKRIDVWCTHLLLLAYMDRSQEYRELRRWMHYYFARNPNPNRDILVHLLPPCLALNDAPDQTRLLALADLLTAISGEQRRLATASILQGIARYRCGDDAAALTALADGRKCELASYRAAGAFFESLAYRRLGQHADAELAFDRGCRLMRDLPEPGLTDLSKHYNPWFLAHIAYREAAAALRATGNSNP